MEVKCPSCSHPVGDPVVPGHPLHQKVKITPRYIMICCRCLEFLQGKEDGSLRILNSKERAYLLIHRPIEMINFLAAAAAGARADDLGKS